MGPPVSPPAVEATVDATGTCCPVPILELAKALRPLPPGARVVLLATDPAVEGDLEAFCAATGHTLESLASDGTIRRAFIRKAG